jgi:hypothetical protein
VQLCEVAVCVSQWQRQAHQCKTRSWERAEQKAREIRDSFDPIKQLQRQLEAKTDGRNLQVEVAVAVEQFIHEVARLNRAEATRAKYKLTLSRLLQWCADQEIPISLLSQLDVASLRRWIHSWTGAPTTLHNQHQRVIAFFNFCIEQGWLKENPARKIKKVPRQQEETLPFTREQYDALIEATYQYDGRSDQRNGQTTNSRRARAYLKLLRWSGLRAGDAACLAKSKLRLLKLIDLHAVTEISRLMRRSQSSIWHMLQRMGANAKMGKDSFTTYTLAVALHVRPEKVQDWIARSWLKAREVETGRGKRTVIEAEDFCEFCRKHTRDVVGNRLTEERLDFVYHFVFPPSHTTLLPVRESMKECNAYDDQMRGKTAARATSGLGSEAAGEEGDMLGESA